MSHYQNIIDYLEKHQVSFKTIHHEETRTSEESARVRGVDLKTGGKALVLKIRDGDDNNDNNNNDNNTFAIFVLSASRKLHTKAIKKEFRSKNKGFSFNKAATNRTTTRICSMPNVHRFPEESVEGREPLANELQQFG